MSPKTTNPTLGLYIHIPWCPVRCIYCDFNTYLDRSTSLKALYHAALLREIREAGAALGRPPLDTIFFGGGTPTTLRPEQLIELVETVQKSFQLRPDAEITTEANPGTLSTEYLREVRQGGINRLSMGVQSFDNDELRFLSRLHDANTARQAVEMARTAGFDNISLDLIFNLPYQTLQQWQYNVRQALKLAPDHFSFYSLIVEPNTPLHKLITRGEVPEPDDDIAADMYEWTMDALDEAGYVQYEISNWAKHSRRVRKKPFHCTSVSDLLPTQTPPLASAHNLIYWRNQPYLGLGAGAYGTYNGERWANVKRPQRYIEMVKQGAGLGMARDDKTFEHIDRETEMLEHMMLGLRLVREGVGAKEFETRFGVALEKHYANPIAVGIERGLLEWVQSPTQQRLRLTKGGRLLANQAIVQFFM